MTAPKPTRRVRRARSGPTNSAGEPFREGQAWSCARCGGSGPDRDDRVLPECRERSYHDIVFAPVEHAAKIAARKESSS